MQVVVLLCRVLVDSADLHLRLAGCHDRRRIANCLSLTLHLNVFHGEYEYGRCMCGVVLLVCVSCCCCCLVGFVSTQLQLRRRRPKQSKGSLIIEGAKGKGTRGTPLETRQANNKGEHTHNGNTRTNMNECNACMSAQQRCASSY